MQFILTVSVAAFELPQALVATTLTLPAFVPQCRLILVVPCPLNMEALEGAVHVYELTSFSAVTE